MPLIGTFGPADRIEDIAAVPDSVDAWAALVPFAERGHTNVKAHVAFIDGATGETTVQRLPASGSGRGAAARIAFTSASEGWLVTAAGWLFHYSDGSALPVDTDPAFAATITFRPERGCRAARPGHASGGRLAAVRTAAGGRRARAGAACAARAPPQGAPAQRDEPAQWG